MTLSRGTCLQFGRLFFLVVWTTLTCHAGPLIRYVVTIREPARHKIEVEATTEASPGNLEWKMAIWTPYLVRDYAGQIEGLEASDAQGALKLERVASNRWAMKIRQQGPVRVRYQLYARRLQVQDNYVDSSFALLNGAGVFLTLAGAGPVEHRVQLKLPPEWRGVGTSLKLSEEGEYVAKDYDELTDSPILAGNLRRIRFEAGGKVHELIEAGDRPGWPSDKAKEDLAKIAAEQIAFWRGAPYESYRFLNAFVPGVRGQGMEHASSTMLLFPTPGPYERGAYIRWIQLASHELFHAWNVKRLRPAEIVPGEFERQPVTPSLGIAEGFTSYYGSLLAGRAGVIRAREVLHSLSHWINRVQTTPGRLVQSLADSSREAFIKFYKPDENSLNTTVDYYAKGAVVGMLLDVKIRKATNNQKSLDDVMRAALEKTSAQEGYTLESFRRIAEETTGLDLRRFFQQCFEETAELDYTELLDWYGLEFRDYDRPALPLLGVKLRSGSPVIESIERGTPAYEAGLDVEDELIAVRSERLKPDEFDAALAKFRPGELVTFTVSRRGQLLTLPVTLGRSPQVGWELEPAERSTNAQKQNLALWLMGSKATPPR
jgi:predicted metalloprotease with PDZ domain